MRTVFYLNGKKVSKKSLVAQLGEQRVANIIAQAKEVYMEDPMTQNDFWLGGQNMLTVEFQF